MLPKARAYVKSYDGQTKWMYFLIEDDNLLEKYKTIWADLKKNLIASLSIKVFCKKNLMVMKLSIFKVKKFLRKSLLTLVSSNQLGF